MKYFLVVLSYVLPIYCIAQSSAFVDGMEFSYAQQNEAFKPESYADYYSRFSFPKELIHPDSLIQPAVSKGFVQKSLFTISFLRDSIWMKPDSNNHRFDRLKIGLGAGRSRIRYYQLTTQGDSTGADSVSNYTVFEDLFRMQAEYQKFFRTHKKLQFYYGIGLYADIKIGSILSKDGRRQFVYDSEKKVIIKKHPDVGLTVPLGLSWQFARNTYLHYEFRLGADVYTDHMKRTKFLITRGFNLSISVDLK